MENKASKYIPGLGTEFKITTDEINMEEVKKEVGDSIGDVDAYTKKEVDSKLSSKANSSDVYKKTETYSKTEVDTKVGAKADSSGVYKKTETYSKTEVDKLISDLRTELKGGGS
ncbi:hypothetical protein Goe16_00520 [Bacillus phage vB_BsuM-Goe16]|nr:hypothetical protein Goe16_00520 [Bacillus phage vB_BsuM-Goe16]